MIQLESVSKIYRTGDVEVRALDDVSLTIGEGELVAIMGASGSGKSTMMNILGCLDVPTSGRYLLDGVDVATLDDDQLADIRGRKIGFVFQAYNLLSRTTALANVELPLLYANDRTRRARATEALAEVGLSARVNHLPNELSGGQQQRVAIARALVTNPTMLLADEPTGNLDTSASAEIAEMLVQLSDNGRTVVLITHEEDIAAFAKRVIRLRDGKIISDTITSGDRAAGAGTGPTGRHAAGNGHSGNGHSGNGHSDNGHSDNGHSDNGHSDNGHSDDDRSSTLERGTTTASEALTERLQPVEAELR